MPKKTKEDIEDDIKSLNRKRNEMLIELNTLQEKLITLTESYYNMDDSMVKVVCINCNGVGYIKEGEKKTICKLCNGKQYNWLMKYKGENNEDGRIPKEKRIDD